MKKRRFLSVFGFVIQHTVAVTLKLGVGDLCFEFLADAFVFGKLAHFTRTVTVFLLQTLADHCHDLSVLVFAYHVIFLHF